MPFRQLQSHNPKFGFEAHIHPDNLVRVGKIVELAHKLDPDVIISTNPQGGYCAVTIHSNEPKVESMVKAYSDV